MRSQRAGVVGAAALAMALVAAACGGSGGGTKKTQATKESITIASSNFPENVTLANVYGKALQGAGYQVAFKVNLGSRQVIQPALLQGQIDAYPAYAASELEFVNHSFPTRLNSSHKSVV